jgi:outer membrane protein OmpA-like peptidoglycan-associated protein
MAFNLIEAAKNLLPNDLVSKAAGSLGETEGGIQKALSGAIPSVLAGLLGKSSGSGAGGILDIVKGAAGSGILNNLTGLFDGGGSPGGSSGIGATVMGWLRSLFGDKLNNIINAISGFAGIKPSSASAVLSMAAPAALAPIGKYATENNLSAPDLGSFLQNQKNSILSAIPSGFNLTGALGLSSLGDIGGKVTEVVSSAGDYARDTVKTVGSGGNKWLWPLLLLVAIAALIWFFTQKGCKNDTTATDVDTTTTTVVEPAPATVPVATVSGGRLDTATGNYIYDLGNEIDLKLADGSTLRVGENSTEAKLYNMFNDASWSIDTVDKTKNWVTFNRVYFETGKSVLTAESQAQIKNVATILKNFPSGSIKIGGYTDNTGDAAVNKRISDSRAKIVRAELVKLGAGAKQVTEAVGYGPDHPVCAANDTPECKAQNRRVDLKVASK